MISKLKSPYCSADLESTTGGWEYGCTNTECQSAGTLCGTKELWRALIQAKQDLKIATKALEEIDTTRCIPQQTLISLGKFSKTTYSAECPIEQEVLKSAKTVIQ